MTALAWQEDQAFRRGEALRASINRRWHVRGVNDRYARARDRLHPAGSVDRGRESP